MKIIVLIKQVPDTTEVRLDRKTGNLIREGVPSIINPDDRMALECALRLKERYEAQITVLTMGPPQAIDALSEALGMGADAGILLTDRAFAGADTWATSTTLSRSLTRIGACDLILCGRQAIDGDTAQTVATPKKIASRDLRSTVATGSEPRAERSLTRRNCFLHWILNGQERS